MNIEIINEIISIDDFNLKSYNRLVRKYGENNLLQAFNNLLINCKENELKKAFNKYYAYFISIELGDIDINNNTYYELVKKYGENNVINYFKELLEISDNKNEIQKKYDEIYLYVLIDDEVTNNYKNDSFLSDDNMNMYLKEIGNYPLLNLDDEKKLFNDLHNLLKKIEIAKLDENGSFKFNNINEIIKGITDYETLKSFIRNKNSFCLKDKMIADDYIKTSDKSFNKISSDENNYLKNQFDYINKYNKFREKAINSNLRLVVSIAKRYFNRGIDANDLVNEGNLGLMKAVARFDVNKGCKFSTYATWWIKQSIQRYVADKGNIIRLPVHLFEEIKKYERSYNGLALIYGREISDEEMASVLDWPLYKVMHIKDIKSRYNVDSLYKFIGDDEDTYLIDVIPDTKSNSLERIVDNNELKNSVAKIIKTLSPKEQYVIIERFGLNGNSPKTLEEVGTLLSVTRERARQIEAKAIRKLRLPSKARNIKDFYNN